MILEGFAKEVRKAAAQGAVLLENKDMLLPIKKDDVVSVFGRTQLDYYRSGTGSGGAVNVEYTTNLISGLKDNKANLNEELLAIYEQWIKENPFVAGTWGKEPWCQEEMPLSDEIVANASAKSNKAIVVLGRTAGEDRDNANESGSLSLAADEFEMLKCVTKHFENVIVVLNVSNILEMEWYNSPEFKNPIKSLIYTWHGGLEGGNAAADVLTGKVTPSGKLTDTIAYKTDYYPSTKNYGGELENRYEEDIYVGYRYFETFCPEKVQYEFGFGLSYTNFEMKILESGLYEDKAEIVVSVKNIGDTYSGKEVAQVYVEAPQGALGKPKRVLAGFQKSKLLAPGEIQKIKIEIDINKLASYDDSGLTGNKSCYVLEAGVYKLFVGNSVRKNELALEFTISDCKVVEKLQEAMAPVQAFERIRPGRLLENGSYELAYEPVPTATIDLKARIEDNLPNAIPITGNKGFKLIDVYNGKIELDDFIAQMTEEQLVQIVRGEGMCSPKVTAGTASCFGGVSDSLLELGIPISACSDGPSGIRMDGGGLATQLPIGTCLAASWDLEMMKELYVLEGKELVLNEIDTLLGPGMNIRRSPMCGRNFEYFSEDPFITGTFAKAMIEGIQEGGANGTLKHLACNNQETNRHNVDAIVSERAIREIYIKGFEIAVKEGHATSVMTSYNPVNNHWSASNYDLNTTILRNEWGFDGIVMTDWWAKMNDCVEGGRDATVQYTSYMVRAQNDLYMVVGNFGAELNTNFDNSEEALENGTLTVGELQRSARNILKYLLNTKALFRSFDTMKVIEFNSDKAKIDGAMNLDAELKIELGEERVFTFNVAKDGVFSVLVNVLSNENALTQSSCSVSLNAEQMSVIQTNGTYGNWTPMRLSNVKLSEGSYELSFENFKNNLQIQWIEFKKVKG